MSNFTSPETGDFDKYFMTTTELIDRFAQGGLWNWGYNAIYGQLGDSTLTNRSSPIQTVSGSISWEQVASGDYTVAAIKTDNTLWLWGSNANGELGVSTRTHRSSPVQTIAGGSTWKQVACGSDYVAAIKTDNTLWLWGYNINGELGDNTKTYRSSPVQTIAGGTNWKQVSCGFQHTAAIKIDGTLWNWGDDYSSELGKSTTASSTSSPVQTICGGNNWKQVSCGVGYTAAIKTDNTLWLWGSNDYGELGLSTYGFDANSPIQTICGGNNWKQVACGNGCTAAIKTNGTLWNWGSNASGQLGDNTITNRSSPVQTIAGGTNWKQAYAGYAHNAAIKTDGSLWLWGADGYGQLGDGATAMKSSPVQTIAGGTNWKQVACGRYSTIAIQYSDIGQVL